MIVYWRLIQFAAVTHAGQLLRCLTFFSTQVDVFAYGIILCEIIARIEADPDILPRTEVGVVVRCCHVLYYSCTKQCLTVYHVWFQDFGLDVGAFARMVGDCPTAFFNLAVTCCNVRKQTYFSHKRECLMFRAEKIYRLIWVIRLLKSFKKNDLRRSFV